MFKYLLRTGLLAVLIIYSGCITIQKMNRDVIKDPNGGFYRSYFSLKAMNKAKSNYTGIEHCTVKNNDIKCVDLDLQFEK